MSLNPYLYFDGQCEEAFKFYEKCLGGKITFMMTWEDSPMAGQAPPGWAKKILHAGLPQATAYWRAEPPLFDGQTAEGRSDTGTFVGSPHVRKFLRRRKTAALACHASV